MQGVKFADANNDATRGIDEHRNWIEKTVLGGTGDTETIVDAKLSEMH